MLKIHRFLLGVLFYIVSSFSFAAFPPVYSYESVTFSGITLPAASGFSSPASACASWVPLALAAFPAFSGYDSSGLMSGGSGGVCFIHSNADFTGTLQSGVIRSCPINSSYSVAIQACICISGSVERDNQCVPDKCEVGQSKIFEVFSGWLKPSGAGEYSERNDDVVPSIHVCDAGCSFDYDFSSDFSDPIMRWDGSVIDDWTPYYFKFPYKSSGATCSTSDDPKNPTTNKPENGNTGSGNTGGDTGSGDTGSGDIGDGDTGGGTGGDKPGDGAGGSGDGDGGDGTGSNDKPGDGSGGGSGSVSSDGQDNQNKDACPDGSIDCNDDGLYSDDPSSFYQKKDRTFKQVFSDASSKLQESGIGRGVSNFLSVPEGGSCPHISGVIPVLNATVDFSVICSDFVVNALSMLRMVLFVCASFFAFRVAIE